MRLTKYSSISGIHGFRIPDIPENKFVFRYILKTDTPKNQKMAIFVQDFHCRNKIVAFQISISY